MHCSGTKAAPSKLFKCPFPVEENPFSVGMKLEAIDPEHPALICVVTVAEIQGEIYTYISKVVLFMYVVRRRHCLRPNHGVSKSITNLNLKDTLFHCWVLLIFM